MTGLNSDFFTGIVSSSDAGTYNVTVDSHEPGQLGILQGIPLMTVFATSLGFKECPPMPVGANVLCCKITAGRCYILGIIPEGDIGNTKFFNRAALKTADGSFDEQNVQGYGEQAHKLITHNLGRPTDLVEGEYAIANDFGVMLAMFQQLVMLKASDLAQIQCFLLDDLVRIVSHNFQHFSALGEFNIWHDGKAILAEFGATHSSPESIGTPIVESESGSPVFSEEGPPDSGDDSTDYYKFSDDDKIKAIERLKIFIGKLGDFLHLFLVRPDPDAKRKLNGEVDGNFDTGLADIHVSTDGRISMRSVSSIVFEKTNWIMVPQRVRTPEDPKGDKSQDIEYEVKDPFKFDNQFKFRENPIMYHLQMRDCVAYLQDLYNYKNFISHEKDFKLSKSSTSQENTLNQINKVDPKTEVKFSDYVLRRSGAYLMDNGGIMLKDAFGSAIVMDAGNIYLQPAKDLVSQPLRHNVLKAGHSMSLAAKKHLDISSSEEGLRVKTKKTQHYFAQDEGLIFQTDTESQSPPTPDSEAYDQFGGILFMAKESGIFGQGKKVFLDATEDALFQGKQSLAFRSKEGDITVLSEKDLRLFPTGRIDIATEKDITIVSSQNLILAGSNTNIGKEGSRIGMVPSPDAAFPTTMDGVIPVETVMEAYSEAIKMFDERVQQKMVPFSEEEDFEDIKFRFLSSDKYDLKDSEDFIPMTIAQQDSEQFGTPSLGTWQEEEIEETLPFPGKDKFETFYITGKMVNLDKKESDYGSKDSESLKEEAEKLEKKSLNEYKIYE